MIVLEEDARTLDNACTNTRLNVGGKKELKVQLLLEVLSFYIVIALFK